MAATGGERGGVAWRRAAYAWLVLACFACMAEAAKDMTRKSIVFDKNTPDVFYCPIHKPTGFDKLIVKARPLKKLCEFEGRTLPEDYKSDCYQDVDESDYACKEKYRIMMRMHPPGGEDAWDGGQRMAKFLQVDRQFYVAKMGAVGQREPEPKQKLRQPQRPQRRTQSRGAARYQALSPQPRWDAPRSRRRPTPQQSHLRDRLRFH